MVNGATSTQFTVTRWDVASDEFPQDFRSRYEDAVPPMPVEQVVALAQRNAPWDEMLELIANAAPLGFLIYARNDVSAVMSLAGAQHRAPPT